MGSACTPRTPGTAGQNLESLQPRRLGGQGCGSSPPAATFPSTGNWAMSWFGRNLRSLMCAGWVQRWTKCLARFSHGVSV